jgi:hypothetical protein
MGFTKLDEGILMSSVMAEDSNTFKVWIALLASCKEDGISRVSTIGLASHCFLTLDIVKQAIKKLESPDTESRSTNDEGKRIRRVDGGFEIINYQKYREMTYSETEAKRKYIKRNCPDISGHVQKVPDYSASASASASASEIQEGMQGEIEVIHGDNPVITPVVIRKVKETPHYSANNPRTILNIPDEIKESWDDWIEQCAAKRNKKTDKAKHIALKKLNIMTQNTVEQCMILNQSTESGWTGLFPLRKNQQSNKNLTREERVGKI